MNAPSCSGDPARKRFLVIQLTRIGGVLLVIAALLALNGVFALPALAGYALLAAGMVDIFIVPQILARKWRTPNP